jgi:ATP-binding cassette subfamily B protein
MSWGGLGQGSSGNLPGVAEIRRLRGRLSLVLEDVEFGKVYDSSVVIRLLGYARPHLKLTIFSLLTMLVYIATQISVPLLVGLALNQFIQNHDLPLLDRLAGLDKIGIAFLIVAVFNLAGNYLHLIGLAKVNQAILRQLRVEMHSHLQRLSTMFFDHNEVGRLMSRVQNDAHALQEFMTILAVGMAEIVSLGGIIVLMLIWDFKLALISFAVMPVFVVIMVLWQGRARRSFMRIRYAISGVNASLQESISGVRVTQSMNRESINLSQFEELNKEHLDANVEASKLTAGLMPSVELLTAIAFGLLIVIGGKMEQDGSLQLGTMVGFALYVQRFFEPIRALVMQYAMMQRAMTAGMRIFELLDVEPELVDSPSALTLPPIQGKVEMKNVSFHYAPSVEVLHNVSLDIEPGQRVAIVGRTGAGKSTIVALMARFYDVTDGSIQVDGYDIRDIKRATLANQISMVLQEPFLFSSTISDNIRFSHRDVTDQQIEEASKALGLHEFILRLPQGYDTVLHERGNNLSLGQRQLIAFARALVADPRILILDEATANVDSSTENLIQNALKQLLKGRTAIIIAHRLSTIMDADKIVVMSQGEIVESGRHQELMKEEGLYSKLYFMNFQDLPTESSNS